MNSVNHLVAACVALRAAEVPGLSLAEQALMARAASDPDVGQPTPSQLAAWRDGLAAGEDRLGEAFCRLRSSALRRPLGQVYTPPGIVHSMIDWVEATATPVRVVDPGTGSGRFLLAAGQRWSDCELVGVEVDPLAALVARANLAALGLASRARVEVRDFRRVTLPDVEGPTAFVGNPPYVRHHDIPTEWKTWLTTTARRRGLRASQLSGLHVHFFLALAGLCRPGDLGALITSAEWLDVNYGRLVRELLLDALGGQSLHILEPTVLPFADAAATGAITCFDTKTPVQQLLVRRLRDTAELKDLSQGVPVSRETLAATSRWSTLTRQPRAVPAGFVELGELVRVHRGAVTGANAVWVGAPEDFDLPEEVLARCVTRARELFAAGTHLRDASGLACVVDLPRDLESLAGPVRERVDRFLERAEQAGVPQGYVAAHRPAWWSIGLREPAPILATYMARKPPAFVRNLFGARHINIAHGLYPREPMTPGQLDAMAACLRQSAQVGDGRTYAGGLTKFEPREMERLLVPGLEQLGLDAD